MQPDETAARCPHCLDEGHVCEDHPDYPWAVKVEGHDGETCRGAGMPCPYCCSPIPEDGTYPIALAFVPDWKRERAAGSCDDAPRDTCAQMWRDDDGELQFCALERGHRPECATAAGWRYSETVEMT